MKWYYQDIGAAVGPLDIDTMGVLVTAGKINAETHLRKEGCSDWIPLKNTEVYIAISSTPQVEKKRSIFDDMKAGYTAGKEDYIKRQALAIAKKEEAAASVPPPAVPQIADVQPNASQADPSSVPTAVPTADPVLNETASQSDFWWGLKQIPYSIWIGIGLIIKGVVIGKRDYNWVPFGPNGMSLPLETYVIDIPSTVIGFMSLLIGLTVLLVRNR